MIGLVNTDSNKGTLTPVSTYNPSDTVRDLTKRIQQDFQTGQDLLDRPFTEFNDMSLMQRVDIDQKRWNAYRLPESSDPDDSWRYNGIRPLTRNKIIAIVAQMTVKTVIPAPTAQNDQDEVDKAAAEVMRDLMEYDIRNSSYVDDYIAWITDALVNPSAYLGVGFYEAMQTIKEETNGKIKKHEVIDGVLSGFQTYTIPIDEVLIANFYQKDLARQRFVIRRRYIEYDEAELLYGEHTNFEYIQPGIKTVFDQTSSLFYDVYDKNLRTLCEEVHYYNRLEDTEVCYVNGIYLGDTNVEANLVKHRDQENRPKYNFAVLGYEPISSRFFHHKSAAWKLGDDDELVQRMEQLTVDATFLSVMPPSIISGAGVLNESINIPAKTTFFEDPNVKLQPIQLGNAIEAGWKAVEMARESAAESSQDVQRQGIQSGPQKTAREAVILEQNAKIQLGLFGNMLRNSLIPVGYLILDVILHHQTLVEVKELTNGKTVEKWPVFNLTDIQAGGKNLTKRIKFAPQDKLTLNDYYNKAHDLIEEEGGINGDTRIIEVADPEEWRKLKYHLQIETEELMPKNELFEKAMKQEAYDRLAMNPLIVNDREAFMNVTKDFLVEPYAKGDTDKYMPKQQVQPQVMQPGQVPGQPLPTGGQVQKITQSPMMP
jgi:hypothetical protein